MNFSAGGQQAARYLQHIAGVMTMIAADFNAFMERERYDVRLEVNGGEDGLFLRVRDLSRDGEIKAYLGAMGLGYDFSCGQMSLVIDLSWAEEASVSEHFFALNDESISLLKRRCFAEIMVLAGPVAGGEYLAYHKEKFDSLTPLDRKLH